MRFVATLDCGCAIHGDGKRSICPTCAEGGIHMQPSAASQIGSGLSTMRPEVQRFAAAMERVLSMHDATRGPQGWQGCTPEWLLMRLKQEVCELEWVLTTDPRMPDVQRECADVANFAMMIYDVIGEGR